MGLDRTEMGRFRIVLHRRNLAVPIVHQPALETNDAKNIPVRSVESLQTLRLDILRVLPDRHRLDTPPSWAELQEVLDCQPKIRWKQ